MAQKYTLVSSTTVGDRLGNLIKASVQLSTGDLVMLVKDPAATDPNKITLQLVPGTAHTTPSTIATLSTYATQSSSNPVQSFSNTMEMALCRDSSDNLYVIGASGNGTGGNTVGIEGQAFTKGSGLTWTPQAIAQIQASGGVQSSIAVLWANTGGGTNSKGHLLWIIGGAVSPQIATADAGALLSGSTAGPISTAYPTTVNVSTALIPDVASNGFGATSGWSIFYGSSTNAEVGTWSVTSSGIVSYGHATNYAYGTQSATTRARLINTATNRCAVCTNSSGSANQIQVALIDQNAASLSTINCGTASNFPTPGAGLSWDGFVSNGNVYILGWSTAATTTLLAIPISFPSDVATVGSTVTIDTAIGSGDTNTTLRAVKNPVDTSHVDIQTYDSTSAYGMYGDFANLPATAAVPTLLTPATLTSQDLASGYTFTWQFNPVTLGDAQVSYAFQRQASGAAPEWWTGSAWQSTEIFVTSGTASTIFTASNWTRSTTYTWLVAVKGVNGVSSGYAAARTVYSSAALPSTPSMTATYQAAPNNRVALVITGTSVDIATVQVSRDGGSTWANLLNASGALVAGAATYYDYGAPSGTVSSYRVSQLDSSQGVYAIASAFSATVTATPALTTYWLRDPSDGTLGQAVYVVDGTFATQLTENSAVHFPLGADFPIVLADTRKKEDGSASFFTRSTGEDTTLKALLNKQSTLLLQSLTGEQWYIRQTSSPQRKIIAGLGDTFYREWSVTWVNVAAP